MKLLFFYGHLTTRELEPNNMLSYRAIDTKELEFKRSKLERATQIMKYSNFNTMFSQMFTRRQRNRGLMT